MMALQTCVPSPQTWVVWEIVMKVLSLIVINCDELEPWSLVV